MAWITPIVTWTPSPVNNADFNRIEGNTKYLREENKTINGTTTLTSLLTISSSGLTSSSSSIDLLKQTKIVAGGENTPLWIESTDAYTAIVIKDDATTQDTAIVRFGDTLALNWTGGNVVIGKTSDNGTDLLQVGSDSDISVSMGRGKLGGISSFDNFYLSHYDHYNINDVAVTHFADGSLRLNSVTGKTTRITENGSLVIASFGASSIELKKDTTITGSLSTSGIALINGAVDDLTNKLAVQGDAKVNGILTLNGLLLPTASPTESSITRSTTGSTNLPRGMFSFTLIVGVNTGGSIVASVQKKIDSTWKTIATISKSTTGSQESIPYFFASTGDDLRLSVASISNAGATLKYTKH